MENELNKMTAVQWFIEKLEQKGDAWENVSIRRIQISIDVSDYLELKRQAKQMGKEQIEDAYLTCHKEYTAYGKHWEMGMDEKETFEQYYNETYGGNNGK